VTDVALQWRTGSVSWYVGAVDSGGTELTHRSVQEGGIATTNRKA